MRAIFHPDRASIGNLRLQCGSRWFGKHGYAILPALAFTHNNDLAIEVDLLDAQLQAFHSDEGLHRKEE